MEKIYKNGVRDEVAEYGLYGRRLLECESRLRGLMCEPDDERDRARIEAERISVQADIDAYRAAIATTPPVVVEAARAASVSYPCAGARDGCRVRVRVSGAYCRRCAHDEE